MLIYIFFFFNDTATTEIYTLSLHDALPIWTHLDDERLVIRRDHWVPHLQSVELLWILHRQRQRAALRPHEGHGALVLVDRFDGAMHRHRRDLTHSRLDAGRLRRRDRRRRPRHCPEREGDSDGQRHDRRGYSKNVLHHDALLERTGVALATAATAAGGEPLPRIGPAPAFTLTAQDDRRMSLADLRGKVLAVTFIYASCVDTCPLLTVKMAGLQAKLGSDFGSRVALK